MIKQCICQAKKFKKEAIFLTGEEDHKMIAGLLKTNRV